MESHNDPSGDLRIIDFTPNYAGDFRRLNVEWITQHWELEEADEKVLGSPEEYVINRGGAILMALYPDRPVGSVALIPYDATTLELSKMAVSPSVQGKGIGQALCEQALKRARQMGAQRVYLESNKKLGPALALYQKLGFRHLQGQAEASPYKRCDVCMEKFL